MREYEVMLILPAEADESAVGGAVERITKILSERGGEVRNIDRWGRRRFAYPIARQSEGYYVVVRFTSDPDAITEIDRSLTLADEVLRFKVVVREEVPVAAAEAIRGETPSPLPVGHRPAGGDQARR